MARDSGTQGGLLNKAADAVASVAIIGAAWQGARHAEPAATAAPRRDGPGADGPAPAASRGGVLGSIDGFQQRHRPVAFVVGVVRKFGDDRAGRLAALIAYYAFFSIFPLLLAATTIVAYVVGDRSAQDLQDSALGQIPVLGTQVGGSVNALQGSPVAVVVGVALALWAGLACMQAVQDAMNEVWEVPRVAQPGFLPKRLRSLGTLVVMLLALATSTTATQLVTLLPDLPGAARVGGIVVSVLINAAVFWVVFQTLAQGHQRWRQLVPGAVVGGVGYTLLQAVGQWYVNRTIKGASDTYGTFAVVIGLLSWLYLLAQLVVVAAEVNVVATRRLWPRALFPPKLTQADRRVIAGLARSQQLRPEEHIDVTFEPTGEATSER
jgi:inner membrane protein YhjD